jgi:hypothetical protein
MRFLVWTLGKYLKNKVFMGRIMPFLPIRYLFIRPFTSIFMLLLVWDGFRTSQKKKFSVFLTLGKNAWKKNRKKKISFFDFLKSCHFPIVRYRVSTRLKSPKFSKKNPLRKSSKIVKNVLFFFHDLQDFFPITITIFIFRDFDDLMGKSS